MNNIEQRESIEEKINLKKEEIEKSLERKEFLKKNIKEYKVYFPLAVGASISFVNYILSYFFNVEGIYVGKNIDLSGIDYHIFIGILGAAISMPISGAVSFNRYLDKCSDKNELWELENNLFLYNNQIKELLNKLNELNELNELEDSQNKLLRK